MFSGLTSDEQRKLKSAKSTCVLMTLSGVRSIPFALALASVFVSKLPMNFFAIPPFDVLLLLLKESLKSIGFIPKGVQWFIPKMLVFVVNYWYTILIYGTGIMLTNALIMVPICISVAIGIFERAFHKVLASQNKNAILTAFAAHRATKQYREVQILTGYFNDSHKNCVVMLLITTVSGQVINILGLLSDGKGLGNMGDDGDGKYHELIAMATGYFLKVSYLEGVVLCVSCINFIFGFCGGVHDTSRKCLDGLMHLESLRKNKLLRRMVMSMPIVKVKCGSNNCLEKITPVVYQEFANEKIVDTLLLRSN